MRGCDRGLLGALEAGQALQQCGIRIEQQEAHIGLPCQVQDLHELRGQSELQLPLTQCYRAGVEQVQVLLRPGCVAQLAADHALGRRLEELQL